MRSRLATLLLVAVAASGCAGSPEGPAAAPASSPAASSPSASSPAASPSAPQLAPGTFADVEVSRDVAVIGDIVAAKAAEATYGNIYAGTIYAGNQQSGRPAWTAQVPLPASVKVASAQEDVPVIVAAGLFVTASPVSGDANGSESAVVAAFEPSTGKLVWSATAADPSGVALEKLYSSGDEVMLSGQAKGTQAFDAATGRPLWTSPKETTSAGDGVVFLRTPGARSGLPWDASTAAGIGEGDPLWWLDDHLSERVVQKRELVSTDVLGYGDGKAVMSVELERTRNTPISLQDTSLVAVVDLRTGNVVGDPVEIPERSSGKAMYDSAAGVFVVTQDLKRTETGVLQIMRPFGLDTATGRQLWAMTADEAGGLVSGPRAASAAGSGRVYLLDGTSDANDPRRYAVDIRTGNILDGVAPASSKDVPAALVEGRAVYTTPFSVAAL